MPNTIVLGMQWGDEGKGKIVDLVCPAFDAVTRFQGGHNAGHTVKFADRHFALHFLPSGILHDDVRCVLGNGVVIAPEAFFDELEGLEAAGIEASGRLHVSDRAQVILPAHVDLDRAREQASGDGKIGTTVRGIGPTYEGKAARWGLRTTDLSADDLEARLAALERSVAPQLRHLGSPAFDVAGLAAACRIWAERLAPFLDDTATRLSRWIDEGRSILFEGAQGTLLDVDHGTYPFVTSSSTSAGGACTGAGVPPKAIDGVLGVIKAYTTRVGGGPFTTELHDATGDHLRRRGNEVGTTTGRPRRCGWLDVVAARYARMLNGIDALALTKLDVLDEVDEVAICVGYRHRGEVLRDFPAEVGVLERAEPVYRTVPGWRTSTVGLLEPSELPQAAKDYVSILEEEIGAPVAMISTGPRREETMLIDKPELGKLLGDRIDRVLHSRGTP